jgi:hypothetical protein
MSWNEHRQEQPSCAADTDAAESSDSSASGAWSAVTTSASSVCRFFYADVTLKNNTVRLNSHFGGAVSASVITVLLAALKMCLGLSFLAAVAMALLLSGATHPDPGVNFSVGSSVDFSVGSSVNFSAENPTQSNNTQGCDAQERFRNATVVIAPHVHLDGRTVPCGGEIKVYSLNAPWHEGHNFLTSMSPGEYIFRDLGLSFLGTEFPARPPTDLSECLFPKGVLRVYRTQKDAECFYAVFVALNFQGCVSQGMCTGVPEHLMPSCAVENFDTQSTVIKCFGATGRACTNRVVIPAPSLDRMTCPQLLSYIREHRDSWVPTFAAYKCACEEKPTFIKR